MHSRYFSIIGLVGILFLGVSSAAAQQTSERVSVPEITFTVEMSKPHTHLLEVEVRVKRAPTAQSPSSEVLVMPVWTPGSYLIREFERHVQDFAAKDAAGQPLQWEKIDKDHWRVTTNGASEWLATYRVYANELSVRTSELNSDHAFWNNATLLMYVDGYLKAPSTLHIFAPQPWKIATALPPAGAKNTFRAESFDILYDSPVEVGSFKTISFDVKGVPHRIVIDGEGNYDPELMRRDVKKVVETEVELMGGEIPYHDYTFFLHLRSNAGGGLEHLNSTALGYPRFAFTFVATTGSTSAGPAAQSQRSYRGFLSLVAHEFFHLWNVKRIRPDTLGPFDYTKENYTKLLWVAEGITDYYADRTLRNAGFISDKEFLATEARAIQALQHTPGRLEQSVEESSFDTWVKYYRQDENSINSQISYYEKGAILGMLLELEIRKRSNGAKSLDDVMRYLYREFYKKDRNYSPADFQRASEMVAGSSLEEFFAQYVRSTAELDYNGALAAAGLRLDTTGMTAGAKPVAKAYLGADLSQEGDRLMVSRVYAGSPAYEQGLNTGDQIVALDNRRVTRDSLDARLAEKSPGQLANLTIFRFDDLSYLPIRLGGTNPAPYRILPLENRTDEQKRVYRSWLGADLVP